MNDRLEEFSFYALVYLTFKLCFIVLTVCVQLTWAIIVWVYELIKINTWDKNNGR